MKVSIDRKRPQVNKLFGGSKEADYESAMVSIHFSEDEKSTIRQNHLQDRVVYEHPQDKQDYEEGQDTARTHPNSYAGKHPAPRYKRSKFVGHFLEEATQGVYDRLDTPMRFAEIQQTVENNLRELKKLMEGIQSFPATNRTFDI